MSSSALSLPDLLAPVQSGLAEMRAILARELRDSGPVGERVEYLARFRGKELRAAMVLLAGQATGNAHPELPQVAAVLELIHLATLVHDDVLDGADLRRNLPSVHAQWDEQTAILLGDMLYSRAFHLSTRLSNVLAARVLSQAAQRICAGEMEQAALRYSFDLSQERYEAIAEAKTAELYAAACELGARFGRPAVGEPDGGSGVGAQETSWSAGAWDSQPQGLALEMREFGREVGLAFQIIDDVLDLEGLQEQVGKRVGNDVEDGKVTLPVLHVYQRSTPAIQNSIRAAYLEDLPGGQTRIERLREVCDLEPGLAYAKARANSLLQRALERAQALPASEARTTLIQIAEYILRRKR